MSWIRKDKREGQTTRKEKGPKDTARNIEPRGIRKYLEGKIPDPFYSVPEVAKLLGFKNDKIYELIDLGELIFFSPNGAKSKPIKVVGKSIIDYAMRNLGDPADRLK